MITKTEVINLITKKLPSSQVFVENLKGNDHLQVTVIASEFDGLSLVKQHQVVYSDLNSSFKGIDARIPNEMQRKGKQTLQILAESNQRLASLYIKTEKPEVAVPLLIETIRIMSPNSPEGKEAYERLIQLGFVETKYKG